MPKLVLKFKDSVLQEIPLNKSCVTIGRTGENDVVINNLGVSRQHARIIQDNDEYTLEDLGSRNGTILNNEEIKHSKLKDKDEIVIGKHTVVFSVEDAADSEDRKSVV